MTPDIKTQFSNKVIEAVKPEICPTPGDHEVCTMIELCFASQCSQANQPMSPGQTDKFEIHYQVMFPLTLPTPR